ncbi:MAG TPA: hypothetical protein DCQ29_02100 [Chitinophagaceae bacterium]|nr:hypothetical protein [Chitinophagaceae bacterium]
MKEYKVNLVLKNLDGTKLEKSVTVKAANDSSAYSEAYYRLLAEMEVYHSFHETQNQPLPMFIGVVTNDVGEVVVLSDEKKNQIERSIDSIEINVLKRNFKDSIRTDK